jgi:hypothetical protein
MARFSAASASNKASSSPSSSAAGASGVAERVGFGLQEFGVEGGVRDGGGVGGEGGCQRWRMRWEGRWVRGVHEWCDGILGEFRALRRRSSEGRRSSLTSRAPLLCTPMWRAPILDAENAPGFPFAIFSACHAVLVVLGRTASPTSRNPDVATLQVLGLRPVTKRPGAEIPTSPLFKSWDSGRSRRPLLSFRSPTTPRPAGTAAGAATLDGGRRWVP